MSSDVTTSRIIAGAGNIINFNANVSGASIVGGTGNDSVSFTFFADSTGTGPTVPALIPTLTSSDQVVVKTSQLH